MRLTRIGLQSFRQMRWQSCWARVDFATAGHLPARMTQLGALVMLVGLSVVAWQWQQFTTQRAMHSQLALQLRDLQRANHLASPTTRPHQQHTTAQALTQPQANRRDAKPTLHAISPSQKALVAAQQLLQADWFPLFTAIESAQRPDIALLALLPNAQTGHVQLKGEAKHYQALLAYLSTLQSVSGLSAVHLQKHQVVETHPQQPVSFEIEGQWQP